MATIDELRSLGRLQKCPAVVMLYDDRMDITSQCDENEGHEGPHRRVMSATEPMAVMTWTGTYTSGG